MTRRYVLLVSLLGAVATAQDITGVWNATVINRQGEEAAFVLELARAGTSYKGTLVNGSDRQFSTSGSFQGNKLRLEFNYWDGVLEAQLANGEWNGTFTRRYRKETLVRKFHAQRGPVWISKAAPQTNFTGEWMLQVQEDGKLSVNRALVKQKGSRAEATLVEISGDSGLLVGIVERRRLLVSRFDGIRATRLELRMNADGTVEGMLDTTSKVTGSRAGKSSLEAPDATKYTRMKGGEQRFRFSYPDLDGKLVASTDPRFVGKVVVVTITGSWCPNCHEEAPILRELYEKYHAKGLEIVAIGFEYTGEHDRDLRQLRLFRDKFKLPFPILLAGTTEDAPQKLSQLENFAGYPTTLYIGRDGTMRGIHAGFDGPATGSRYSALRAEMQTMVGKLLAEK